MLTAGVSTACLYPLPTEDALYELALGGVQRTEIFINTHSELRKSFIMSMAELLRRFDMKCCSLHPFTGEMESMMFFSPYERRVQDMLDYYKHYFAAMEALGAEVFVLHGGKAAGNVSLYAERFSRIAETAKEFGVTVAQENVARFASRSVDFLTALKKELGDQARFVLDVKQAVRSGENPDAMLEALGSSVVHVHISDHGAYGDCQLLGNGSFQIKRFLTRLSELSLDCSVMLELYRNAFGSTGELVQNYQVLERMIQSLYEQEKKSL